MSLSDELETEASTVPLSQQSQVPLFLNSLSKQDRADVEEWIEARKNCRALYRVLKRRGLPVAESTFRNWVTNRCR